MPAPSEALIWIGPGLVDAPASGATTTRNGIRVYNAVDAREAAAAAPVLKKLPSVLEWESKLFGPYPFRAAGAIVVVMLWLYWSSELFFVGAVVARVVDRRLRPPSRQDKPRSRTAEPTCR